MSSIFLVLPILCYRYYCLFKSQISNKTEGKVLLLRRSEAVWTCPGTWSFIGEHAKPDENGEKLAWRAAIEELGVSQEWLKSHVISISRLSPHLIWERHDYNDGRIDREFSELWVVKLAVHASAVPVRLDADTAEYKCETQLEKKILVII